MINPELTLDPTSQVEDQPFDRSLRPKKLSEYIGQSNLTRNLRIILSSAKQRQSQIDHLLFYGPPGLGKTTLASIVAYEAGVNFKPTAGPSLSKVSDLASILTGLTEGTCCLSTRFTVYRRLLKRFSIRRWKIFV